MKRAALVLAALALVGGRARGDAFDRVADGAPLYVAARPVALVGALQRLGVDQLPSVQRMRRQLGGIDPFNPAILAAPGIDVAAPLVLSLFEAAGPGLVHTRVAATLRDPAIFGTFVDAVAASGQVKLQKVDATSALGKAGVLATGMLSDDTSIVVRVKGAEVIIDVVSNLDGKKAPAPAELARRFSLTPARAFRVEHGARRLFAPEAAAVAYVDGRRMAPLLRLLVESDQKTELKMAAPSEKAKILARQRARTKKCAVWWRAPATFDDVALALGAAPEQLSLTLAWGTQTGAPLGGLKLRAADDAGLDAELLGRDATLVVALYAASLQPFLALKRPPPFQSVGALNDAMNGCEIEVGGAVLMRAWPLALGTFGAPAPGASSPLSSLQQSVGALRTVVVALRDVTPAGPRGAVTATLDAAARPMLELLLGAAGSPGAVTTIGKRSPTVYPLQVPGMPRELAAALESLVAGKLAFTVADSDDSLRWAFRAAEMPTSAPADATAPRPLLRLAADAAQLAQLGAQLGGKSDQPLLDLVARLRRVDGDLVADGDLLRLTVRSPLKQ